MSTIYLITIAVTTLITLYELVIRCYGVYYAQLANQHCYMDSGVWIGTKKPNRNFGQVGNTVIYGEVVRQLSLWAHPAVSVVYTQHRKFRLLPHLLLGVLFTVIHSVLFDPDLIQSFCLFINYAGSTLLGYVVGLNKVRVGDTLRTVRQEIALIRNLGVKQQVDSLLTYRSDC